MYSLFSAHDASVFLLPFEGEGGEMRFGIEPDEGDPLTVPLAHLPSIVIPAKAGIQLATS